MLFGFGSLRTRVLFLSLSFLGTGVWMLAPTWNASKQVDCNLSQLQAGQLPDSNWVKIHGRLLWDYAAAEEGRGGRIQAYFVPLVSGSWHEGHQVPVIVRINQYDADEMQNASTVEGLIQPMGLPFDLKIAFSGDDEVKAAENVVYIHHGTDPTRQRRFAQVVLAIGFAGLIGFVVLMYVGKEETANTYHSLAKPKDLNDAVRRTPEESAKHQEQEAQRESEIDRWMRERGLKKDEPAAAPEPETPVTSAP